MLTGPIFKYLSGGLALALLIFIGLWKMEQRHARKADEQLHKCTEARRVDRQSYEHAQRDAAEANRKQVEHIRQQQETINDETVNDLNSRIERLRHELQQGNSAPRSDPKGPGAGNASPAPQGTPRSSGVCLSPEELLRAAENEERHDQLITWVERQSQVKP